MSNRLALTQPALTPLPLPAEHPHTPRRRTAGDPLHDAACPALKDPR
jgi:hypothetical protein